MRLPVYIYYSKIPMKARYRIRRVFLSLVHFPIIDSIYRRLYYAHIRKQASHGFSSLVIEGYNVCNLRCVMCPYPVMTREKILMSMELFQKIIDDAVTNNIRVVCLNDYNEPLLDSLLFERIKYAKSKDIQVTFNSNGCLLTDEKISALLNSGLDSVYFSVDGGTKEAYESVRIGANFEKTRDNIVRLIKERNRRGLQKPSVFITFATQKSNYHSIKAFRSFWQGLANGVSINEVDSRSIDGLLPAELNKRNHPRHLYPCPRLFNEMCVLSNGKVALCCMDYDGSIILGDLNK